jgi:hypothetical protein
MATNQNSRSSSSVGLAIAEEITPKVLSGSPVWYAREANSYPEFGATVTETAATPISASRQNQEGSVTDLDATAGYNMNLRNDLEWDMQGFFFADAHEKADTLPLTGSQVSITGVAVSGVYNAASGLAFAVGQIVRASGFTNAANNGIGRVTTASSSSVTLADLTTVVESSPPSRAKLRQVGFRFASADLTLTVNAANVVLTSTASAWANVDVQVGEWLFIGGDAATERFNSGYGFGRVSAKTNSVVTLDNVAWEGTIATENGSGKTIAVYTGTYLRNEDDPSLIKCRTYQIERTLGDDGNGTQSQIEIGSVANTFTANMPLTGLAALDLAYIALDEETRTGTQGLKSGTRVPLPTQQAYNTTGSVWRHQVVILDPTTLNPTQLYGFATAASYVIDNGATALKAIGELGGIDINVGNFAARGTSTAYFMDVESLRAVRESKRIGMNSILAGDNRGVVLDLPYARATTPGPQVALGEAITIDFEKNAFENPNGYTASMTFFDYLPDIAMPS